MDAAAVILVLIYLTALFVVVPLQFPSLLLADKTKDQPTPTEDEDSIEDLEDQAVDKHESREGGVPGCRRLDILAAVFYWLGTLILGVLFILYAATLIVSLWGTFLLAIVVQTILTADADTVTRAGVIVTLGTAPGAVAVVFLYVGNFLRRRRHFRFCCLVGGYTVAAAAFLAFWAMDFPELWVGVILLGCFGAWSLLVLLFLPPKLQPLFEEAEPLQRDLDVIS